MNAILSQLPVIAVGLVWAERMREVAAKRDTIPGRRRELWTFSLFVLCGVVMTGGGIAEYYLRELWPVWPLFAIGLALSIGSFVLRRRTIAALGRFWSLHVEMREGHEFVRSGPFRWMRHPVYFSMILELLGPALILGAWWTLLVVAAIFIPTMCWRLRIEEAALVEQFGDAYQDYRRTTPMLLPYRFPSE